MSTHEICDKAPSPLFFNGLEIKNEVSSLITFRDTLIMMYSFFFKFFFDKNPKKTVLNSC